MMTVFLFWWTVPLTPDQIVETNVLTQAVSTFMRSLYTLDLNALHAVH